MFQGSTPAQKLGLAGFIIGVVVGFLMRPEVPFFGQLPFDVVISAGEGLKGMDRALLIPIAQKSLGMTIGGGILGAICGALVASALAPKPPEK